MIKQNYSFKTSKLKKGIIENEKTIMEMRRWMQKKCF